jgi:hypothetical protein
MISLRHRYAANACLMLGELLFTFEVLSVLVTPWRMNEYGQWPHSFIGRAALWFKCKAASLVLPG